VAAGLKDRTEPHKAARLAIQVLRGFGEFESDGSAVNVSVQTLSVNPWVDSDRCSAPTDSGTQ
jgi:hypothetical protein